jgi:hypothetical protein
MNRSRSLASVVAACAALVFAGCGGIDSAQLETKIKAGIETQTGKKLKSVDCPENRELKKGDVFTCKATFISGESADVKVTQTDDKGNIVWQLGG